MANDQNSTTPKKISLQELMQQKLAAKKQANGGNNNNANHSTATKSLKTQLTKKPNNQKRRTGV